MMGPNSNCVGEGPTEVSTPSPSTSKAEPKMTLYEHLLVSAGCGLSGMMTLIPFQFLVVILPISSKYFLDEQEVENSVLGLYQAGCVLGLFFILKIGSLHKWLIQAGLMISLICMAAVAPCLFYGSVTSRVTLLHIILFFLGVCNAFLQASGFARAAILPRNYVDTTSIGQATAGVFVFIVTGILFNRITIDGESDAKYLITIICILAVAMYIVSVLFMHVFLNAPVCVQSVQNARGSWTDEKMQPGHELTSVGDLEDAGNNQSKAGSLDETLLPPRPWGTIIKHSFWELTSVFLVFFVSFSLFPKVGPNSFNFEGKEPSNMVLLFGMQFVGDLLGRSCVKLPGLHSMFSFVFLPRRATIIASFLRFLFYVPFVLAMKMENVAVINNFVWLMIMQFLLAFTLGWIATLALIHSSLSVTRFSEKARMGSLSTITLAVAIGVGLYVALAF
ncbi:putative adenosine transporter [Cyclospora cayetanensis]|nr:putative adenosine transporter [Cyclospora cayetanensis]